MYFDNILQGCLPVDIEILPELQVIYVSEPGRETDLLTDRLNFDTRIKVYSF